jgi:hypothetical protein
MSMKYQSLLLDPQTKENICFSAAHTPLLEYVTNAILTHHVFVAVNTMQSEMGWCQSGASTIWRIV